MPTSLPGLRRSTLQSERLEGFASIAALRRLRLDQAHAEDPRGRRRFGKAPSGMVRFAARS
ncbi:hypothetical protein ACLF3G_15245 [Falsiroseomonas sp. HC035]|uniref:hypothetical protein n=1 Tax=Falsiroseomonas sp. HC035 TaxID=3390999 RepID=UPI003D313AD4